MRFALVRRQCDRAFFTPAHPESFDDRESAEAYNDRKLDGDAFVVSIPRSKLYPGP